MQPARGCCRPEGRDPCEHQYYQQSQIMLVRISFLSRIPKQRGHDQVWDSRKHGIPKVWLLGFHALPLMPQAEETQPAPTLPLEELGQYRHYLQVIKSLDFWSVNSGWSNVLTAPKNEARYDFSEGCVDGIKPHSQVVARGRLSTQRYSLVHLLGLGFRNRGLFVTIHGLPSTTTKIYCGHQWI